MSIDGTVEEIITFTPKALERIARFADTMPDAKGLPLRIAVKGGGCSGFQYGFSFEERQADDHAFEKGKNLTIVIDPISYPYLQGSTVDYVDDLRGAGFIVNNPSAVQTCGCGHSFDVQR